MKNLIKTLSILTLITPLSTLAFNGSKCWKDIIAYPATAMYKSLGGKDHRDGWLLKPFGSSTGTTGSMFSFFTSTGKCSALAQIEKDKIEYFAFNHRKIQREMAQGSGESLDTLTYFYGKESCSREFQSRLKSNYEKIYASPKELWSINIEIKRVAQESGCNT